MSKTKFTKHYWYKKARELEAELKHQKSMKEKIHETMFIWKDRAGKAEAKLPTKEQAKLICGNERPLRKTLCQLKKGHKGSCRAIVFWETR